MMTMPRASLIITIVAIAFTVAITSIALRMSVGRDSVSVSARPTPPLIDPSEFAAMSPDAYNALVDYQRDRDSYERELIARIRAQDYERRK